MVEGSYNPGRQNDRRVWDDQDGGFFFTGKSHETLIVRFKDYLDNATPSGNSVAADVFFRLSHLLGNETYARKAVTILRLTSESIARYPSAFGRALGAMDFYLSTPKEIAVIGELDSADTLALLETIWGNYFPNKIVAVANEPAAGASELVPLLRDRTQISGKAAAYVCENYTCQSPVTNPADLLSQLTAGAHP